MLWAEPSAAPTVAAPGTRTDFGQRGLRHREHPSSTHERQRGSHQTQADLASGWPGTQDTEDACLQLFFSFISALTS